ncbi:MAG: helix-turn-helix domain-containing protein [Acidimicrobiia bacterium]
MTDTYNQTVGERLRAIRRQKGLSLQEVEALSHQEFKASVLGAYERGERSLSLPRMHRLAAFYGVPVDQLLPQIERGKTTVPTWSSGGVTIDLSKLEKTDGTTAEILERFLRAIQIMRQDFNGRVLTIRRSDLQLLAGLLEEDQEALGNMLVSIGAADAGTA